MIDDLIYITANLASKLISGSVPSRKLMGVCYCINYDGNIVWERFLSDYMFDGNGINDITIANDLISTDEGILIAGQKGHIIVTEICQKKIDFY